MKPIANISFSAKTAVGPFVSFMNLDAAPNPVCRRKPQ